MNVISKKDKKPEDENGDQKKIDPSSQAVKQAN